MRASRRGGGFTLAELLVYVSLVTTGFLFVGSLLGVSQEAAGLQGVLLDMQVQADRYLVQLRRDVEVAARLEAGGEGLTIETLDGRRVRYAAFEREVRGADGQAIGVERFPDLAALRVEVGPGGAVSVEARFVRPRRGGDVVRTYRRTATPRQEVAR